VGHGLEVRRLPAEIGGGLCPGLLRSARRELLGLTGLPRQDFGANLANSLIGDGAGVVFGGAIILGPASALGALSKRGGLSRAGCCERLCRSLVPDQLLDSAGSIFLLWRWRRRILQFFGLRRY
jgi:hypothetical protein